MIKLKIEDKLVGDQAEAQKSSPTAPTAPSQPAVPPPAESDALVSPIKSSPDSSRQAQELLKVHKKTAEAVVEETKEGFAAVKEEVVWYARKAYRFLRKKRLLIPGAVLIALLPLIPIGISLYYWTVLSNAESAIESGDYAAAIEYLDTYLAYEPEHAEAILMLAQSYIYQKDFIKAEDTLNSAALINVEGIESSEQNILLALLKIIQGDHGGSIRHVERVLKQEEKSAIGHYLQSIVRFYGERNMQEVQSALSSARQSYDNLSGEAQEDTRQNINFIRRFIYSNTSPIIARELPLPFERLTAPSAVFSNVGDSGLLQLRLFPEGFYNYYSVPTERGSLFEEELSVTENILLFQAVAAVTDNNTQQANAYLAELKEENRELSLYYLYLDALIQVQEGNYTAAAAIYRRIKTRVINVDVNLMLASALWAKNKGALPPQEIIDLYEETLQLQADNPIALANLGYLRIYNGELEAAREILEYGMKVASNNFQIVYSAAYLDIITEGNLERAEYNLYALRERLPDSAPLALVLAQALARQGKYSEAINELDSIKAQMSHPDIYLEVASLYRQRQQPLLVLANLQDAREAFPGNDEVLLELLLENARQNEIKQYKLLLAEAERDGVGQDYRALLAKAVVEDDIVIAKLAYRSVLEQFSGARARDEAVKGWLRLVMIEQGMTEADEIIEQTDVLYSDTSVPYSLQLFRIWRQSLEVDEDLKEAYRTELELLAEKALTSDEQIDLALAWLAVDEVQKAIDILEELPGAGDVQRFLKALAIAYETAEDSEKTKETQRRLQVFRDRKAAAIAAADAEIARKTDGKEGVATEGQAGGEKTLEEKDKGLVFAASGKDQIYDESQVVEYEGEEITPRLTRALKQKNYQLAIDLYSELLASSEEHKFTPALVYQNRGVLYMNLSQHQEAVRDFEQALQLDLNESDRIKTMYNYALALASSNQYDRAGKVVTDLLELRPEQLRVLLLYTQILQKQADFPRLITVYNKIISLAPEHVSVYVQLAEVHRQSGDPAAAIQTLQAALRVDSRSKLVHRNLAELYATTGNTQKAQEHVEIMNSL